jgi:hypothetical protein
MQTGYLGHPNYFVNPYSAEPSRTWVHSYAIASWTKQAGNDYFNWIDKMVTFEPKQNNLRC